MPNVGSLTFIRKYTLLRSYQASISQMCMSKLFKATTKATNCACKTMTAMKIKMNMKGDDYGDDGDDNEDDEDDDTNR